jgi:hypothetical protein
MDWQSSYGPTFPESVEVLLYAVVLPNPTAVNDCLVSLLHSGRQVQILADSPQKCLEYSRRSHISLGSGKSAPI